MSLCRTLYDTLSMTRHYARHTLYFNCRDGVIHRERSIRSRSINLSREIISLSLRWHRRYYPSPHSDCCSCLPGCFIIWKCIFIIWKSIIFSMMEDLSFSFFSREISKPLAISCLFFSSKVTHTRSIHKDTQLVMLTHYSPLWGWLVTPICHTVHVWSQAEPNKFTSRGPAGFHLQC